MHHKHMVPKSHLGMDSGGYAGYNLITDAPASVELHMTEYQKRRIQQKLPPGFFFVNMENRELEQLLSNPHLNPLYNHPPMPLYEYIPPKKGDKRQELREKQKIKDVLKKQRVKENYHPLEGGKSGKNKTDTMAKKKTLSKNSDMNSFIDDDISSIEEMSDQFEPTQYRELKRQAEKPRVRHRDKTKEKNKDRASGKINQYGQNSKTNAPEAKMQESRQSNAPIVKDEIKLQNRQTERLKFGNMSSKNQETTLKHSKAENNFKDQADNFGVFVQNSDLYVIPHLPNGQLRFNPQTAEAKLAGTQQTNTLRFMFGLNFREPIDMQIPKLNQKQKNYCINIIQRLKNHKSSAGFKIPVNPQAQSVPDYHKIVYDPMDLHTVAKKVLKDKYRAIWEFDADINRIFLNSYKYNLRETVYFRAAIELEDYYHELRREALQRPEQFAKEYILKTHKLKKTSQAGELDFTEETPIKKKSRLESSAKLNESRNIGIEKELKLPKNRIYSRKNIEDYSVMFSNSMVAEPINEFQDTLHPISAQNPITKPRKKDQFLPGGRLKKLQPSLEDEEEYYPDGYSFSSSVKRNVSRRYQPQRIREGTGLRNHHEAKPAEVNSSVSQSAHGRQKGRYEEAHVGLENSLKMPVGMEDQGYKNSTQQSSKKPAAMENQLQKSAQREYQGQSNSHSWQNQYELPQQQNQSYEMEAQENIQGKAIDGQQKPIDQEPDADLNNFKIELNDHVEPRVKTASAKSAIQPKAKQQKRDRNNPEISIPYPLQQSMKKAEPTVKRMMTDDYNDDDEDENQNFHSNVMDAAMWDENAGQKSEPNYGKGLFTGKKQGGAVKGELSFPSQQSIFDKQELKEYFPLLKLDEANNQENAIKSSNSFPKELEMAKAKSKQKEKERDIINSQIFVDLKIALVQQGQKEGQRGQEKSKQTHQQIFAKKFTEMSSIVLPDHSSAQHISQPQVNPINTVKARFDQEYSQSYSQFIVEGSQQNQSSSQADKHQIHIQKPYPREQSRSIPESALKTTEPGLRTQKSSQPTQTSEFAPAYSAQVRYHTASQVFEAKQKFQSKDHQYKPNATTKVESALNSKTKGITKEKQDRKKKDTDEEFKYKSEDEEYVFETVERKPRAKDPKKPKQKVVRQKKENSGTNPTRGRRGRQKKGISGLSVSQSMSHSLKGTVQQPKGNTDQPQKQTALVQNPNPPSYFNPAESSDQSDLLKNQVSATYPVSVANPPNNIFLDEEKNVAHQFFDINSIV